MHTVAYSVAVKYVFNTIQFILCSRDRAKFQFGKGFGSHFLLDGKDKGQTETWTEQAGPCVHWMFP